VKSDAVAALMHCFDIGIERATGVIEMIDQGRIPNIKIHY
jgi:hypothetical protein